jgi:hypothetical protein
MSKIKITRPAARRVVAIGVLVFAVSRGVVGRCFVVLWEEGGSADRLACFGIDH